MNGIGQLVAILAGVILLVWISSRVWRGRPSLSGSWGPTYWLVGDAEQFAGKPPDTLVAIGYFRNGLDAEVYKLRLDSEGIDSAVFGDLLVRTVGPQLGTPLITPIELRVRAEDADRALETLRTGEPAESPEE